MILYHVNILKILWKINTNVAQYFDVYFRSIITIIYTLFNREHYLMVKKCSYTDFSYSDAIFF